MKKYVKDFENYLLENEGRLTSQKQLIAEEILKKRSHFEVEDFIDSLRKMESKISRATVYRTIKQLLDGGLLQKISTRDGKVFYEKSTGMTPHDHLICNTCGKILEIKDKKMNELIDHYCDTLDFHPQYRSLHIYGECKQCFNRKNGS